LSRTGEATDSLDFEIAKGVLETSDAVVEQPASSQGQDESSSGVQEVQRRNYLGGHVVYSRDRDKRRIERPTTSADGHFNLRLGQHFVAVASLSARICPPDPNEQSKDR